MSKEERSELNAIAERVGSSVTRRTLLQGAVTDMSAGAGSASR